MAGTLDNRSGLLAKLLKSRTHNSPDTSIPEGRLGDIMIGNDLQQHHFANWHWKNKSLADLRIEFINSNGNWKMNTILDPGLKSWPVEVRPASADPGAGPTEKEQPSS